MNIDARVYFDTEFTGLRKDTDLISIGMVAVDPRVNLNKALYLELEDYDKNKVTTWVKENVISNLLFTGEDDLSYKHNCIMAKCNKARARAYIYDWLKDIYNKYQPHLEGSKVQLVSDVCHYDFTLFLDLFGTALDLPDFISPVCVDLNDKIAEFLTITPSKAFDQSREEMIQVLDGLFKLHKAPLTFDEETVKSLIPEVVMNKKHNSLYDALIISKLYSYIEDAEQLRIFN